MSVWLVQIFIPGALPDALLRIICHNKCTSKKIIRANNYISLSQLNFATVSRSLHLERNPARMTKFTFDSLEAEPKGGRGHFDGHQITQLTVGSGSTVIFYPDNVLGPLNRQTVEWTGEQDVTGYHW